MARKTRTAAQKAATHRMVAANRSRRATPKRAAKRRSNPIANPVGIRRVKRTSARRATRRTARRSNPSARGLMGVVGGISMQALQGAGGALAINTALNYMPFLPAALSSGNGKYLARAGLAVAVGVFGGKVLPGRLAHNMAVGAMTVALHDLLLGLASDAMPTMKLGDVGDYDTGVSAYVTGQQFAGIGNMGAGQYDVYDTAGNVGEYIYS